VHCDSAHDELSASLIMQQGCKHSQDVSVLNINDKGACDPHASDGVYSV
jgi:hypothetical protein